MPLAEAIGTASLPTLYGCYTVPAAREGTLLHFDFSKAARGDVFTFELTGPPALLGRPTTRQGAGPLMDAAETADGILTSLQGRLRVYQYLNTLR